MTLPIEILFGIYLGILTGIVPALVAGVLGFVFKYFTGVTIPGLGVVVLALAIAGINGGLLALNDETIRSAERAPAILTAIIVVLMLSLYAHAQGDKLGANAPKRVSLKQLRDRTLSADVVELVGGRGRVRLTVTGEVADMEGYPPASAATRQAIVDGEWTFPADLPLDELETRFAERLRTEFDLSDVSVSIDENARATVAAAPPVGGLSKRVPSGKRAVSVPALVPTGLARGDVVRVVTPDLVVEGTLLSANSGKEKDGPGETKSGGASVADGGVRTDGSLRPDGGSRTGDGGARTDGGGASDATASTASPAPMATAGGEGRVTVAVDRSEASALLRAGRGRVLVLSRGTRREYELTTLLRRAGKRFRRVTVVADGPLDGYTIGEVGVREAYDVAILAARHESWTVAPRGNQSLSEGDELFVVGNRDALARFEEAAK